MMEVFGREIEPGFPAGQTAYCPHCRAVANLRVTVILEPGGAEDGSEGMAICTAYHCEACLSFVRSEESFLGNRHEDVTAGSICLPVTRRLRVSALFQSDRDI